ncbi:MAG: hypothetical protein DRO11_00990 [Methanobacteriota archaeon]|nr:MAG: hypothetical protein DRO11_00990 [Euryarchaeota archaeon]
MNFHHGQAELTAQLIEEVKKRLEGGDKYFSQVFGKMRSTLREKYSSWLERLPLERRPAVGFIVAGFEENKDAKSITFQVLWTLPPN